MAEVLRGGQGFSTAFPKKTDIIIKPSPKPSRSRSRSRAPKTPSVIIRGGTIIINGKGFSVAPSLQEEFIRGHTGGRGSSAQAAIQQARTTEGIRRQEAAKELQGKAEVEKAAKLKELIKQREERKLAAIELQRIQRQREQIIREGAIKTTVQSKDIKTGDRLEVTQWRKSDGTRVQLIKNLTTGFEELKSFERGKGSRKVTITGGIIRGTRIPIKTIPKPRVFPSNKPGRVNVRMPNGKVFDIKSTGIVNVGKAFAGQNLIFKDGVLNRINGILVKPKEFVLKSALFKKVERSIPKKETIFRIGDFITGGFLTERILNKGEEAIEEAVSRFNKAYGDRELGQKEHAEAEALSKRIDKRQRDIDNKRDELARSFKSKLSGFLFSTGRGRITTAERLKLIEKNQPKIRDQQSLLIKTNEELAREHRKKGIVSKFNIKRLTNIRDGIIKEINRLKTGGASKVYAGQFPIIPAAIIPSGVTNIIFIGKQRTQGGKIITDIVFKTTKEIGVVRGLSVTKGKDTASLVLGRSGKMAFKFPSGSRKVIKMRTFIGKEISRAKPTTLSLKTEIDLIKNSQKIGRISKIKGNIEALKQGGVGKIASIKGRNFMKPTIRFPSGKIVVKKGSGIQLDDFASLSAVITRRDMSLILGNSITGAGAKSRFIGIIKGSSPAGKVFSVSEKQQFTTALNKVISTAAASVAQSRKVSGLTKVGNLALASKIISTSVSKKAVISISPQEAITKKIAISRMSINGITEQKIKEITITVNGIQKPITKLSSKQVLSLKPKQKQLLKEKIVVKQRSLQKQKAILSSKLKQNSKQLQGQRQQLRVRTSQTQKQKLKQTQKQRQQLKTKLSQVQKQIAALKSLVVSLSPITSKVPIIPRIKLPKGFTKKKLSKTQDVFFVVMRRRGKLVKLAARPLTLIDARSYGAYRIDHGLARSFWFEPAGQAKQVVRIPIQMRGYFNKISKKLRPFKIRRGRKQNIRNGYIERAKFVGDTPSEIRELQLSRARAARRKSKKLIKNKALKKTSKTKPLPKKRKLTKKLKKKTLQKSKKKRTQVKNQKKKKPQKSRKKKK